MVPPQRTATHDPQPRTFTPLPRPTLRGIAHTLAPSALLLLPAGCAWSGLPDRPLLLGDLPALLLGGAALNVLLLAVLGLTWERLTRRTRLRRPLLRELRLLRLLTTPEGLARKTALLRELSALGGAPRELDETVLTGADLRGISLAGCRMRSVRLDHADLQGADLSGCELFGADLTHANLAMSSLASADLRSADLEGAQLTKADLSGARLRRANLINADLQGVDLSTTVLEHARFAPEAPAALPQTVHPSVEDWIRAHLDAEGRYRPNARPEPPAALSDAS